MKVVALIIVSCLLIFYKYLHIPEHIAYDEFEFAKLALSLDGSQYTPYSTLATGHSTLYFYILLASIKVFGVNIFALRFPAAVFGVLSVVVFYLIIRKIFKNDFVVFVTTLVFVTSRWFINFARFSFEATFLLFLELTSIYFLLQFLDKKRLRYLLSKGIFAGLAFHSYQPGRIFFLLPLIFLFFYSKRKYIVHFIVAFLIIASPLIIYLIQKPDIRVAKVSILSQKNLTPQQKYSHILENARTTLLMFHVKGDMNGRHNFPGKPALNPILGLLFLAGVVISLRDIKNKYNQLFLGYFALSVVPSLFTIPVDNPNMLRTFTAIPAIVFFVGRSTEYIFDKTYFSSGAVRSREVSSQRTAFVRTITIYVVVLLILISTAYELRTYFIFQSRVFKNSFELTCDLKRLLSLKAQHIGEIPLTCRVSENLF